jgi:serine/threonine protein kinase
VSDLAINFMRECLTWYPEQRPSVSVLLRHPWIIHHNHDSAELERASLLSSQQSILSMDSAKRETLQIFGSFNRTQKAGHVMLECQRQ